MFSNKLKELRKSKSISQIRLSEELGVSKSLIGMYETGDREPSLEMMLKLCDYFGVSLDTLLDVNTAEDDRDFIVDLNANNGLIPVGSRYQDFKDIADLMDDETYAKWIEIGKVMAGK